MKLVIFCNISINVCLSVSTSYKSYFYLCIQSSVNQLLTSIVKWKPFTAYTKHNKITAQSQCLLYQGFPIGGFHSCAIQTLPGCTLATLVSSRISYTMTANYSLFAHKYYGKPLQIIVFYHVCYFVYRILSPTYSVML